MLLLFAYFKQLKLQFEFGKAQMRKSRSKHTHSGVHTHCKNKTENAWAGQTLRSLLRGYGEHILTESVNGCNIPTDNWARRWQSFECTSPTPTTHGVLTQSGQLFKEITHTSALQTMHSRTCLNSNSISAQQRPLPLHPPDSRHNFFSPLWSFLALLSSLFFSPVCSSRLYCFVVS